MRNLSLILFPAACKRMLVVCIALLLFGCNRKVSDGLRKKDLKKDVEMVTTDGTMLIRLSDQTPLHRKNFLKLVKQHFYDSIAFHRIIQSFMIQAGDPATRNVHYASSDTGKIPAEFRQQLYHKKGVVAAARLGDNINPTKASSPTQFYIVQGRIFTDAGLDSIETFRLKGRKLPAAQREVYKTLGGAPHLDQQYTVFGEVIEGLEVIDKIAATPTTGSEGADHPLQDIRILKMRLVKRR